MTCMYIIFYTGNTFFCIPSENSKRCGVERLQSCQAVTAEFLGTLLLTFVGCGSLDDAAILSCELFHEEFGD